MASPFPLTKAYFVALFCEAILHGMFTVLTGGAVYLLLRKRKKCKQRKEKTTTNTTMLFLTLLMYSLATAHISLSLRQNLIAFFDQDAIDGGLSILNDQGNPIVYSQIAVEVINCLLGDSIVCWRAWVLWGRNRWAVAAPASFILAGFAGGLGLVHAFVTSPNGEQIYNNNIMNWFIVFSTFTCAANVYCVAVISCKAWTMTRNLRRRNRAGTTELHSGGTYYSALLVIVESGVIYCIALVITISLFVTSNNGVYVITDMVGHLTGIYPTVIIVLVSLKMTFHDDLTRVEKAMTTLRCNPPSTEDTELSILGPRRMSRGGIPDNDIAEAETGGMFILEPMAFAQASNTEIRGGSAREGEGIKGNEKMDGVVKTDTSL